MSRLPFRLLIADGLQEVNFHKKIHLLYLPYTWHDSVQFDSIKGTARNAIKKRKSEGPNG
jgi:hypothetical protein